jgi:threonine dehydrogenase-like Zn-dependent dehydrogenase
VAGGSTSGSSVGTSTPALSRAPSAHVADAPGANVASGAHPPAANVGGANANPPTPNGAGGADGAALTAPEKVPFYKNDKYTAGMTAVIAGTGIIGLGLGAAAMMKGGGDIPTEDIPAVLPAQETQKGGAELDVAVGTEAAAGSATGTKTDGQLAAGAVDTDEDIVDWEESADAVPRATAAGAVSTGSTSVQPVGAQTVPAAASGAITAAGAGTATSTADIPGTMWASNKILPASQAFALMFGGAL